MFKATVFCAVALTLLSSAALALTPPVIPGIIWQNEDFTIGAINHVVLTGAGGQAFNLNTATIIQNQHDAQLCSGACQDELVLFVQRGAAIGMCGGLFSVDQTAIVGGIQVQLVGDGCDPKTESQALMLELTQDVVKVDGSGTVDGTHTLASVQNQGAHNSAGMMNESNVVVAGQLSSVSGGPSTTGMAAGGLLVTTTQTQVAM